MEHAKNRKNSRASDWQNQIGWLETLPATAPAHREESIDRVKLLIDRCKVVTVAMVVKDLGIPDKTVRRILDELTPAFARVVQGRPTKWRAIARNG